MRFYYVSACCVVLLTTSWLQVFALPQHSSGSSSSAHQKLSISVRSAASDDASRGASTVLAQPAQPQQQQRAAQTSARHVTLQHSAQPSLLVAANAALPGQQASQSEDAHARHLLSHAAQLPKQRQLQQAGAGFGRRVIDSGPALDGGVRLSTAELMAAGASGQSDGQSRARAVAAQREEGAYTHSQGTAEPASASAQSTGSGQAMAAGSDPDDLGPDEQVQPQRSANRAEPTGAGHSVIAETVAAQPSADAEPDSLGATADVVAASSASRTTSKDSGASLGAGEVAPDDNAWWRRVRQDPEQCGIVDAAPATVLRDVEEHTPDACSQLCRCGWLARLLVL